MSTITRSGLLRGLSLRWLVGNPIAIKEIRAQMRGPRAFLILTGYLIFLGLLAYGLYRITLFFAAQRYGMGTAMQSAYIGQILFVGLAFLEMLSICFITPALTAGAISGEYERGTYDMLMATPLQSFAILWGKLIPAMSYVGLLIVAAVPLFSIVYLFGGVVVRDMVQAIALMGITGLTFGSVGMFFSALTRRTGRATVLTYLVVLFFTFGSVFIWLVQSAISNNGTIPSLTLLYFNPLSSLGSAILTSEVSNDLYYGGTLMSLLALLGGGTQVLGMNMASPLARPLWQYNVAIYLGVTVFFQLLTVQMIKPMRRWQLKRRDILLLVLVLLLLAGGGYAVFGTSAGSTGMTGFPTPTPFLMINPVQPAVAVAVPAPVMPTTTPMPTPTPYVLTPEDLEQQRPSVESNVAANLFPEANLRFCEVRLLGSDLNMAYYWAYCRIFHVENGEPVVDLTMTTAAQVQFNWDPSGSWAIIFTTTGKPSDVLRAEMRQALLDEPYDEASAQARLLERAKAAISGGQ